MSGIGNHGGMTNYPRSSASQASHGTNNGYPNPRGNNHQAGGSSSSTGANPSNFGPDRDDDLDAMVSENILLQVTFTRYKIGTPVLYMLKCEVLRSLPPLIGPNGEVHESRNVSLATWTVKKRYSEMEEAHRLLQSKYGPYMDGPGMPEFPPKQWSNALFNTEKQVQGRLASLQAYFDKLLLFANVRASPELAKLLEMEPPAGDALPHFRVCSFGIHQADHVYAVCEIGPSDKLSQERKREVKGRPALFYHLVIRQVRQIGFSSENLVFLREDRLENSGKNMRFNLVLGKPAESYDLSISCSNYQGKNDEVLRIRLLAPSLEDILAEAGNSPEQVNQLMKRICTHCVHDVAKDPAAALQSMRESARIARQDSKKRLASDDAATPSSRIMRAGSAASSSRIPRDGHQTEPRSSNTLGFGAPRLSGETSGFEVYTDSDVG